MTMDGEPRRWPGWLAAILGLVCGIVAVYAVPSIRLVQSAPAQIPTAVDRLTPALLPAPLTRKEMQSVAQRIATRLAAQIAPPGTPPLDDADSAMRKTSWKLGILFAARAVSAVRRGWVCESISMLTAVKKSERPIVVMNPVKAGGAKGPWLQIC